MTYTSLLTQCARLGQADRAGIVLDSLNRKRQLAESAATAATTATTMPTPDASGGETGFLSKRKASTTRGESGKAGKGQGHGVGDIDSDSKDEAWRIDSKLENDLLKMFGQADQVDEALKVWIGRDNFVFTHSEHKFPT